MSEESVDPEDLEARARREANQEMQVATRPRRRWLRTAFRIVGYAVMIGFAVAAVWNAVDLLTSGGPLRRSTANGSDPTGTATTPTTLPERKPPNQQVTIAVLSDIGLEDAGVKTLQGSTRLRPDVYLALGDLTYAGADSERRFCSAVRGAIGPVAPFQIVAGEHEEDDGDDGSIAEFAACLPERLDARGDYPAQYYFDLGEFARVIMLSPDLTIEGANHSYGDDNERIRWVETAIDDARERKIQWVIVGMHKHCISAGQNPCEIHEDLFSLLVRKRVDLVLSGHDHTYQRSKQLAVSPSRCPEVPIGGFDRDCVVDDGADREYDRGRGAVFVVAGTGGGELYDVNPDDPEAGYFAEITGANRDGRHGYVLLSVTPDELSARFLGTSPGDYYDRFTIRATTGAVPATTTPGGPTTSAAPAPAAGTAPGSPTAPSATAQVANR